MAVPDIGAAAQRIQRVLSDQPFGPSRNGRLVRRVARVMGPVWRRDPVLPCASFEGPGMVVNAFRTDA